MNAYVTVAVSTLGAVLIAWTLYRIARRDPRPTFNVEGNRVVSLQGAADHPLEIRYDGERVDRVTRSVVTFWNGGARNDQGERVDAGSPGHVHVLRRRLGSRDDRCEPSGMSLQPCCVGGTTPSREHRLSPRRQRRWMQDRGDPHREIVVGCITRGRRCPGNHRQDQREDDNQASLVGTGLLGRPNRDPDLRPSGSPSRSYMLFAPSGSSRSESRLAQSQRSS